MCEDRCVLADLAVKELKVMGFSAGCNTVYFYIAKAYKL